MDFRTSTVLMQIVSYALVYKGFLLFIVSCTGHIKPERRIGGMSYVYVWLYVKYYLL